MSNQTISGAYAELDGLHAQVAHFAEANAALAADNGALRAQQHDLVRAKEAACADARMLRSELDATRTALHTAQIRQPQGW